MKVALIQLQATDQKKKNIEKAVLLVRRAVANGAQFILLPEVFNFRGFLSESDHRKTVPEIIPGESLLPLMAIAREYKVFILAGSIYESVIGSKKFYNTSVFIDSQGKIKARYRKIHLFDAVLGNKKIKESDNFLAGKKNVVVDVDGYSVGLSVCYDLRFPEQYQDYSVQGVDVLCVPSAFTFQTGSAHWEVLLRARAIENLSYVLAPNQIGIDKKGIRHFGNSMVVDPWGKVLKRASTAREEIIYVNLDKKIITEKRKILPSLKNKRR